MDIYNNTPGSSADDSGTSFIAYTGDTSGHDFNGGTIGLWWDATSYTNRIEATPFNSSGNIDPTGLDADADQLTLVFNSPYNTQGHSSTALVINTSGYDLGTPGYNSPISLEGNMPMSVVPEAATVIEEMEIHNTNNTLFINAHIVYTNAANKTNYFERSSCITNSVWLTLRSFTGEYGTTNIQNELTNDAESVFYRIRTK